MATLTKIRVEQRQVPRILYHDLKIAYDGITEIVDARAPDLSTSGMFINTPHPYPTGAQIGLQFDLLRTGINVKAMGNLRYYLPGIGVGAQFVNLPEDARAAMEKELEEIKNEQAGR